MDSRIKKLFTAGFQGELDWEIMTYIPYLRFIAHKYDWITVCCDRDRQVFYEFANQYHHVAAGKRGWHWTNRGKIADLAGVVKRRVKGHDVIRPTEEVCKDWKHRKFAPLGEFKKDLKYDMVFHARHVRRLGRQHKNWRPEYWGELADRLRGRRICSIGTEALWVPGTEDKRNIPMKELCDLMRSSFVMVSPSSGPAFLAHLCGLPLLTWTSKRKRGVTGCKDRKLHTKLWNPFGSPVKIYDNHKFSPSFKIIHLGLLRYCSDLRRKNVRSD